MTVTSRCPECGAELRFGDTEGLCPKCLMAAVLPDDESGPTSPQMGSLQPPTPDAIAALFPQLEILESLGHGGMGAVYKSRQTKLDRLVALKIIRPETAGDLSFVERFNREARALARLSHPNIVGVFDFGEVETELKNEASTGSKTLFYFIMEYVDGVNLRQLMRAERVRPEQALAIVPQVCEALQYAHEQGVIHRDIKPENILIDQSGRVKIADFGLAKIGSGSPRDVSLTATNQVLGTFRYMAPEQMQASGDVDHRVDIYSLGIVFYEMLTGEVPAGSFDPPSKKAPVDSRLDEVVLRAMANDPAARYQHVSEVGSHISAISSSEDYQPADPQPWPGPSTIVERAAGAVAAQVKGMFNGAPDHSAEDESRLSQEFVTISRKRAQAGPLPDLCMVCGKPTQSRVPKTFARVSPEWAIFPIVLLFIVFFPLGIVAVILLNQQVRMACPVCAVHRRRWSRIVWFASLGWLLIVAGAGGGLIYAFVAKLSIAWTITLGIVSGLAGVALYVIPLVAMVSKNVTVESITRQTITFRRVSSAFARAVRASEDE